MIDRIDLPKIGGGARISNGMVELAVAEGCGPRIVRYALTGGANVLGEWPDEVFETTAGKYRLIGGHRLWAGPEIPAITCAPDSDPVTITEHGAHALTVIQKTDSAGLGKSIRVELAPAGSGVTLVHTISNRNQTPITLAPWAVTILAGGGTAIVPMEPFKSHDEYYLPARPVIFWHYTNPADERIRWGRTFIRFTSNPGVKDPVKLGIGNRQGWAAYSVNGLLFTKRYAYEEGKTYPDYGSNTELYTAANFLEIETLGPLVTLAPGASVSHEERWTLARSPAIIGDDDAVDRALSSAG